MMKRLLACLLAAVTAIMTPMAVLADREDAKLEKPYVALGADLKPEERATVLELLGVTEEDLKKYTVANITNEEEHKYLGSYLSAGVIGKRALSSVLVLGKKSGYGIKVSTQNISYCTVGMYQNALVTAGIEDADIKVAGPFKISGTAALVGAIKAYENMTGETINPESVDTATNELVITGEVADNIGDTQKAEQLMGAVKEEVIQAEDITPEEIEGIVNKAASELEIELNQEDRQKIVDLMGKIDGLDLNVDKLKEQAKDLYDKLGDLDLNLNVDKEKVEGFFTRIVNKVIAFFENLFG